MTGFSLSDTSVLLLAWRLPLMVAGWTRSPSVARYVASGQRWEGLMGSDDITGTVAPSLDRVQIRYRTTPAAVGRPSCPPIGRRAITRCVRRSADVAPGRRSPGWGRGSGKCRSHGRNRTSWAAATDPGGG